MKHITIIFFFFTLSFTAACGDAHKEISNKTTAKKITVPSQIDTTRIDSFLTKHPDFQRYTSDLKLLYRKHNKYIWYDDGHNLSEFASVLYNQVSNMKSEGIFVPMPYRDEVESALYANTDNIASESDFLLSGLYLHYLDHVFGGLDEARVQSTKWFLPRRDISYAHLLDSLAQNKRLPAAGHFTQYEYLRKALNRYLAMEKKGGYPEIITDADKPTLRQKDTSETIRAIRHRFFVDGFLRRDSKSDVFDEELLNGLLTYQLKNSKNTDSTITAALLKELNVPVAERIKTIAVNMERCRWIGPEFNNATDFIAVNIPSFRLHYFQDGLRKITSRVVVGKELNKTVVFSGEISQVIFRPYWYIPNSIIANEITPAIRKNPNYLRDNDMEWSEGRLRQKPGNHNALGLVKFLFPNSNNIYLHDTPSKSLFQKEERAFSHGCIRVERARDLAVAIMDDDAGWLPGEVDTKMQGEKQSIRNLKKKIPVYIAYFTAWADENGVVAFFPDIYKRDDELAAMLYFK